MKTLNSVSLKAKNKNDINIPVFRCIPEYSFSDNNQFSRIFKDDQSITERTPVSKHKLLIRVSD